MAWVRIDDHFDEHPKLAQIGPLGWGVWLAGLAYCNRNLTDGFIPWSKARTLCSFEFLGPNDGDARGRKVYQVGVSCGMHGQDATCEFVIDLLIEAGLWEEVEGGYAVHDYPDYQPTRAEVEELREVRAAAGRQGGIAKAKQTASKLPSKRPSKPSSKSEAKVCPVPDPVPVPQLNSKGEGEGEQACAPDGAACAPDATPAASVAEPEIAPAPKGPAYSATFERFWRDYPRREAKAKAWDEWRKLAPKGKTDPPADLLEAIFVGLACWRQSRQWTVDNIRPHAATWLHQRRWEDELDDADAARPSGPARASPATRRSGKPSTIEIMRAAGFGRQENGHAEPGDIRAGIGPALDDVAPPGR